MISKNQIADTTKKYRKAYDRYETSFNRDHTKELMETIILDDVKEFKIKKFGSVSV